MSIEIVKSLASFLEAIPYQVEVWDKHVIQHLATNPAELQAFRVGTPLAKWRIYSAIKYPQHRVAA